MWPSKTRKAKADPAHLPREAPGPHGLGLGSQSLLQVLVIPNFCTHVKANLRLRIEN